MDLGLGGRGYLLTGASRGLGFATARALVGDGARVLISSRAAGAVSAAATELGGEPTAFGTVADLAEPEAVPRLVDEARDRLGRVDGALISVGGPPAGTVLQTTVDQWRDAYENVVLGPLELVRALVPPPGDGAAIGVVLSTSGRPPLGPLAISQGPRPGPARTAQGPGGGQGP